MPAVCCRHLLAVSGGHYNIAIEEGGGGGGGRG